MKYMKINIYIYISKKLKDPWRSVKCAIFVFDFKGQQIYLIFQLSSNSIGHNDETGHFIFFLSLS